MRPSAFALTRTHCRGGFLVASKTILLGQHRCCRAHAAHVGAGDQPSSSSYLNWSQGDVLELVDRSGRKLYAEVLQPASASGGARLLVEGYAYSIAAFSGPAHDSGWQAENQGAAIRPEDPVLRAVAGWGTVAGQRAAPDEGVNTLQVASASRVTSLEELAQSVQANPSPWCDGTGPSDPPWTEEQRLVATAAELLCLLAGLRGVVLLQLHVGWDAATPPYGLFKPLVLTLLRRALASPDIVCFPSAAPGSGAQAGLTAVLAANKEPYRSWAQHLASFGCQAALEAQSPYYKLLIGLVLGYKPDNVMHHIQVKHGERPSAQVVAAVDQQLTKLSSKKPRVPWNVDARGKKRTASAGGRK